MPRKERAYTWFAEPLGDVAHANKVIARFVEELVDVSPSFHENIRCADGKKHNLWDLPQSAAAKLWASRNSLDVSIKIWCREGGGKIKDCTFLFRPAMQRRRGQRRRAFLRRPLTN